jgi:glycosyltransferase involved in cell wall biosynthesis
MVAVISQVVECDPCPCTIENAILRNAPLQRASSTLESLDVLRLGLSRRLRVIPFDVPSLPPASHPPQAGKVLFLSRFNNRKHLDHLFQALALVRHLQRCLSWSLSIAGTGAPTYVFSFKQLGQRVSFDRYCHWSNFVLARDKLELTQSSDWFGLSSAAKNVAIAAAKSLEAVTPVNQGPEGAVAGEVEPTKTGLISSREPDALAKTLIKVLQPSNLGYRVMALNLAEFRSSWTNIAAGIQAICSRLIDNPNLIVDRIGQLIVSVVPSEQNLASPV